MWVNEVLCIHAGLSPDIKTLKDIQELKRQDNVDLEGCLSDLLWSNPNANLKKNDWDFSTEGIGFQFPLSATKSFLKSNNLSLMVRGHSFCESGTESFHEGRILSVFSATNFCFHKNEIGGIVEIDYMGKVLRFA